MALITSDCRPAAGHGVVPNRRPTLQDRHRRLRRGHGSPCLPPSGIYGVHTSSSLSLSPYIILPLLSPLISSLLSSSLLSHLLPSLSSHRISSHLLSNVSSHRLSLFLISSYLTQDPRAVFTLGPPPTVRWWSSTAPPRVLLSPDTPSQSVSKHLLEGEGGCSRIIGASGEESTQPASSTHCNVDMACSSSMS